MSSNEELYSGLDTLNEEKLQIILKYLLKKFKLRVVTDEKPPGHSSRNVCSDNDDDISTPAKRSKTTIKTQSTNKIPVENRYSVLSQEQDNENETSNDDCMDFADAPVKQTYTVQKTQQIQSKLITQGKIPPIILRDKNKWLSLSGILKNKKINFVKAQSVAEGIKITVSAEDDYRKLYKFLKEHNEEFKFHTYSLKSDTFLKVVLRGVIQEVSETDIEKDLNQQGYQVEKITRITRKINYQHHL